jgi:AcrR family transcriptional regulator
MPRLGEDQRTARRGQILDAALACFARTGYHATTMADIAAEAGVSKGVPYLYFASKETLYVALHDHWDCALSARINAAIATMPPAARRSPRSVLHTLIGAVGSHVTADPQTCRVLMEARTLAAYQPAIAAAVRDSESHARDQLAALIEAGVTAGEWPGGTDPHLHARLITATLHGMMAQWHLAPGSFSWHAVADTLTAAASGHVQVSRPTSLR